MWEREEREKDKVARDKCGEIMEKRSSKSRKYTFLEDRYSHGMFLCC